MSTLVKSSQRAARKRISVLFSQPRGNPILSQPRGNPILSQPRGNPILSQPRGNPILSQPRGNPILSQPRGNPILSQPGGGDKSFSQEGRFCLTKNRGGEKKEAPDRPRTTEDKIKFPRRSRNDESFISFYIFFTSSRRKVSSEQIFKRTAVVDCS